MEPGRLRGRSALGTHIPQGCVVYASLIGMRSLTNCMVTSSEAKNQQVFEQWNTLVIDTSSLVELG